MTPEARAARNEYARKWRERNPDKVKAAFERYWERRAAENPVPKAKKAAEMTTANS